jgi:anti-sigma regulatory factor (Ser/Thr protein kinase)
MSRAGKDEMATEPCWDDKLPSEEIQKRHAAFDGELGDVTGARAAAEGFLGTLARTSLPTAQEHWDDILLVVTELAANAVQYAPGPFELTLRRTYDGVHVMMHDTSVTSPEPRPFHPSKGGGGIGWYLIHTLCDEVSVVVHDQGRQRGKDIHVFLPW